MTTLKSRFQKRDIMESMLWPSQTISDQYESTIIETKDNEIINCLVIREDEVLVSVKTAEIDRPFTIRKDQILSRRTSDVSIMPEGVIDQYSQGDIANLIAFLQAAPPEE